MNYIYTIHCPLANAIRYIGKTNQPTKRLWHHLYRAQSIDGKNHQRRWLRKLLRLNLKPRLDILFNVPDDMCWKHTERFFIAAAGIFDLKLTNGTTGGEGYNFLPPEIEAKRRAKIKAALGRKYTKRQQVNSIRKAWANPEIRSHQMARQKEAATRPERMQQLLRAARMPRSAEAKARQAAGLQRYYAELRLSKTRVIQLQLF